ncbi:MAG: GDP-mannose 4,6-dehydratase [Chlamydiales bacterium]|nr:GDP-mannose 4,6-dehydratase [Chlamydiales bacterium]
MKHWVLGLCLRCSLCFASETPKRLLIFAVTSKGEAYLAEFLDNCDVHSSSRTHSVFNMLPIGHIHTELMWQTLSQEHINDYVVATAESYFVLEFAEIAFNTMGSEIEWHGSALNEKNIDKATDKTLVVFAPPYLRSAEIKCALGDAKKVKQSLRWRPKTSSKDFVKIMV